MRDLVVRCTTAAERLPSVHDDDELRESWRRTMTEAVEWRARLDRELRGSEREHCERYDVMIYRVHRPAIRTIRVHNRWAGGRPPDLRGGASFDQRARTMPVRVRTEISKDRPHARAAAASLRPVHLIREHLGQVRPLADPAADRDDIKQWMEARQAEANAWGADDALWTSTSIVVDEVAYHGVQSSIDESVRVGGFRLPEGRLFVAIEYLKPDGVQLGFEDLKIVRSTDLDRVAWRS